MKSWIEISAPALAANVAAIRAAAPGAELLAVIKADAYGHGIPDVAPILTRGAVRWFGITDAEEGALVRASAPHARILTMVGPEPPDAPAILQLNLTPAIWTPAHVRFLATAAQAAGRPLAIHIEIDTGMSRQGVAPGPDLAALLSALTATPHLRCEGLMTHFAESEVPNSALTRTQRSRFESALQQLRAAGITPRILHTANTSAIDESSTLPWISSLAAGIGATPLIRPGLALYGFCLPIAHGNAHLAPTLTPTLTWKTRILDIRTIPAGTSVGYGGTFTAAHPTRIALLPVGYAEGFRRSASSTLGAGWVMIAGQRAPVAGRVSMNLTTVDITAIPTAQVGDEVTLLGPGVTAEDHARWSGTIAYDILCGIRAKHTIT